MSMQITLEAGLTYEQISFDFSVNPTDTIKSLQAMLAEKIGGISKEWQIRLFSFTNALKVREITEDDKKLADFNIVQGSKVIFAISRRAGK